MSVGERCCQEQRQHLRWDSPQTVDAVPLAHERSPEAVKETERGRQLRAGAAVDGVDAQKQVGEVGRETLLD